ncbi:MAG: hypothetical protein D6730_17095 [Bacteroidetes bacterium]|nr:MAG: hypothetical protein D6730_17095 [Bacteroidota bacterium]
MKVMKLTGLRQMEMLEVSEPRITDPHQVKIRMKAVGICGSDIHYYTHGNIGTQVVEYPFAVGHEGGGVVVEVGEQVKRVKVGDAVAIDPAMPCFACSQCRKGRFHTCEHLRFRGCPGQAEGLLAEYVLMPETSLYPLYGQLNCEHAALSEPLAIGLYAVKLAGDIAGKTIGITGMGPIGECVLVCLKAKGAGKVYATDKIDIRLQYARQNGADWTANPNTTDVVAAIAREQPEGLDIVFECSGQPDALAQTLELLQPGGKLLIIGIPETNHIQFDINLLRRKEITIINVRRQNECVDETLELIANSQVRIDHWVTHRFPFEKSQEGFELVSHYRDGVLKAMICL